MEKLEKGLEKVKEGLKECGFENSEIESLIFFFKNYLILKKKNSP
ncbi:MAG: hypothetical protein QXG39_01425 [Candidatus Aenigmatarchaeota archaeon]